jgi:hypothetical protein
MEQDGCPLAHICPIYPEFSNAKFTPIVLLFISAIFRTRLSDFLGIRILLHFCSSSCVANANVIAKPSMMLKASQRRSDTWACRQQHPTIGSSTGQAWGDIAHLLDIMTWNGG